MLRIPPPSSRRRSSFDVSALLAIVPLLLPLPALAGNQVWSGTSPRAKSIEAIARDPMNPNRIWAAAFGSGVHRTLDGGATWTSHRSGLLNTFVRCLAVGPRNPDSVYCGTNDGIFLSIDGGQTWKRLLSTTASVRSLAIHPVRTATIYAGSYGSGVYKSLNGGATWTQINLGLVNTNVRDVAPNPSKPDTILLATGTGGGVHRSFNGGLTWAQVPDTTATLGAAEQIEWDPLNSARAYVAELDRGVIRTSDGGNTWVRINRGLPTFRTRAIAVVDSLRYLGTDGNGVFFTTLNDSTWHPVNTGLSNLVVDALSTEPASPSSCLAGTNGGGIFTTSNQGAGWTQLDGGLLNTFGFSVAIRPASHRVYAGLGFGDQFWASSDQGATWTRATALGSRNSEHGVVADPLDGNVVYLTAYGSGVYRSDDDGATWTNPDITLSLSNRFVRDVVAWPDQSGHLFVGSGDGPFESTDGAVTWVSRRGNLPPGLSVRSLALATGAPPTLYVGSDTTGIWRSIDGGASWTQENAGLPAIPALFIRALLVDQADPDVVYAATDSGVYKRAGAAASWAPARTGLPAGDVVALAQDPVRPQVLFCAVNLSGVFQSLDSGASWSALFAQSGLSDLHLRSLAVDGDLATIYAGSNNGISALSNYPLPIVSVEAGPSVPAGLRAWPNPLRGGALRIELAMARPGRVRAGVYDVAGVRVRSIEDRLEPAGAHAWNWDGRDTNGRRVAQGLYFLRVEGPDGARTRRIAVLDR